MKPGFASSFFHFSFLIFNYCRRSSFFPLSFFLFPSMLVMLRLRAAYADVSGPPMWAAVGDAPILAWLAGTALLHAVSVHRSRGGLRTVIAALLTITLALCIISVIAPFPAAKSMLPSLGRFALIAVLAGMVCMAVLPLIGGDRRHVVRGLVAAAVAFMVLASVMLARRTSLPAALALALAAAVAASAASDVWQAIATRPAGWVRQIAARAAHLGFALFMVGAVGIGMLGTRTTQPARNDVHVFAGNYMVQFRGLTGLFTVEFVLSNTEKGFRETFSPAVGEVVHTDAAVLQLEAVDAERKIARFWIGQTTRIDGDDIAYAPAEEMEVTESRALTLNDGTVLAFGKVTRNAGPDVVNLVAAQLDVYRIDRPVFEKIGVLQPAVVSCKGDSRPRSRGDIWTAPTHDLCTGLTLDPQRGPIITVALRPFAVWTWIGGIVMALGFGRWALGFWLKESSSAIKPNAQSL